MWRELLEQGSVMGKSIQTGKLQNSEGCVCRAAVHLYPQMQSVSTFLKNAEPSDMKTLQAVKKCINK